MTDPKPPKRLGATFHSAGGFTVTYNMTKDWGDPPPFDPPTEPGVTELDGDWWLLVCDREDGSMEGHLLNPDEVRAVKAHVKATLEDRSMEDHLLNPDEVRAVKAHVKATVPAPESRN